MSCYFLVTRYFLTLNVLSDLSGTCPENAPSNCTPRPTWSPNGESCLRFTFFHVTSLRFSEPLFWTNHAVSPIAPFSPAVRPSPTFFSAWRQMVDKIWYDWQHINPENANSYFGGSVQALESILAYIDYPNGGPPFLDVRSFFEYSRPGG